MSRLFPYFLTRPQNLLSEPQIADAFPAKRPMFIAGDPRPWVPGALEILTRQGTPALPWSEKGDLLLAPWPRPGGETHNLCKILGDLPATTPVCLYERDAPLLPNLIVESKNNNPSDEQSPEACLRRFRSAVRSSGLGEAEALVFLPARRLSLILRGSPLATFQPGPSKSLQNRRYLHHLLDYQRSLSLLSGLVENNSLASSSEELPAPQRVLVLAPHFDDECLLFGQQILNAARAGSEVRVVWMTDGGNESSVRHAEGLAALKVLGVEDSACLQAPESRLTAKGPWVSELRRHLTEFCPQEIMLPWWPDNHVDHFEVTRVLKAAWQPRLQDCNLRLSGFWTPLPFGECCPLNPKVADALKTHKSQLTGVNYLRVFQGLSCWHGDGQRDMSRSWLLPSKEYFSAFRRSGVGKRRYRINA